MQRYYFIFFLLYQTCSAHAAERIPLPQTSFSSLQKLLSIQLEPQTHLNKAPKNNTLSYISARTDENQERHIRLQQRYLGIRVFGGNAILHRKKHDVKKVNGILYQDLNSDLGTTPPYSQNLRSQTLARFKEKWPNSQIISEQIEPIIYIDEHQRANWAYKIQLEINQPNSIPQKPTAIINAYTQTPYVTYDNIQTSRALVKGMGFGGNQKIGLLKYGVNQPFLNISFDYLRGICYLENLDTKVIDMHNSYESINAPMEFTCPYVGDSDAYWTGYNEDGFDKRNGSYSASNDALNVADTIKTMYKKIYNVEALVNYQQKPQQLVMRVHYGKDFGNAFWDGHQMTFGDGNSFLHPLVSLTIGAHEVSHGFTQNNSNLAYFGQSGAINESFSDMAAQAAEYYVNNKNTWKIGTDILKSTSLMTALRFMDKPSLDRRSIEYADHFREGMDVHYASGVFNKMFYILATTPYWTTKKAFKVMIKANMDYWSESSNFSDAACGIIYATEDYNYKVSDVKNALDAVMVDYQRC